MSAPVMSKSKSFLLSSSAINGEEELPKLIEKQGIVSILGSDNNGNGPKAASLRRTLSADMSSKKWLAQNGMKKIASSQHLAMTVIDSSSSGEEEEEDDEEDEYGQQTKGKGIANPGQSDIWSKIMSQKAIDAADNATPPYVHPLVKRSSSLSEKSLEICTESLGSETGSEVFSSHPPSEAGDVDEEKNSDSTESEFFCKDDFEVVKYNYSTANKKSCLPTACSFPPPLPSLARGDGPSLHMHSHRQNGRLVLEAVTVPSQNFFQAQRQNGRLLLTLVNNPADQESTEPDQFEEVFDISEEDAKEEEIDYDETETEDEEEEETIETNYFNRSAPKLASEVINVHRSAIMLKKQIETANKNPTWLNKAVSVNSLVVNDKDWEEQTAKHPQSLPPLPPTAVAATATATSFNSYEYFWRAKPTVASVINQPITKGSVPVKNNISSKGYEQKDLVLLRGNKADCLVPLLRGCKKPGRSLLFWEPHCIATS